MRQVGTPLLSRIAFPWSLTQIRKSARRSGSSASLSRPETPSAPAMLGSAYAAADLFVLPSRYEGYGIVYAEALAQGLPVIACEVGPVPELVGDEAALLVPPGDVEALSEGLDLLLGDATRREQMSAAARRRAGELPRWEDTTDGFLGVLREAAAQRSRPGPM